jgi:hypothetical protein
VLARPERFEHLAAQADDRSGTLEDIATVVGNRIVSKAAGESVPVTIVERGGITNEDLVDGFAIEQILK